MPTDTATKLADFLAAYRSGDASCLPYLADWLEDHDDPRTAKVRGLVRWHLLTEAHAGTGGDDTDVWAARDRLYAATGLVGIRLWACLCARWLPLHDGRRVADLLTDARSVTALAVAELHWCGLASQEEAEQAAKEGYAASGELWEKWRVAARAAAAAAAAAYATAAAAAQAAYAQAAAADAAAYAAAAAQAAYAAATARAAAYAAYAADADAGRKAHIWAASLASVLVGLLEKGKASD